MSTERGRILGKLRNQAVHFSHESDLWETPDSLFQELHEEFDFTIDGAANADNAKLPKWMGDGSDYHVDALAANWFDQRVFLNPPYSQCWEFVKKASEEAVKGATVVMLLPARTDTKWFHTYIWDHTGPQNHPTVKVEVRFIKGRVKFTRPGKPLNSAPFPSMVVIFKPVIPDSNIVVSTTMWNRKTGMFTNITYPIH